MGCPYAIVQYSRFGGTVGAGHDLSVSTQLWFDLRFERIRANLPLAASDLRGFDREPIKFDVLPGASTLSTLRTTLLHDTRDEPILPTRGWHLAILADTALAPIGSDYHYTKLQIHSSKWWTLPWGKHVARLDVG